MGTSEGEERLLRHASMVAPLPKQFSEDDMALSALGEFGGYLDRPVVARKRSADYDVRGR